MSVHYQASWMSDANSKYLEFLIDKKRKLLETKYKMLISFDQENLSLNQ